MRLRNKGALPPCRNYVSPFPPEYFGKGEDRPTFACFFLIQIPRGLGQRPKTSTVRHTRFGKSGHAGMARHSAFQNVDRQGPTRGFTKPHIHRQ